MTSDQNRRNFLTAAAGAAAFTIVPRHVLGGQGVVAPSDQITLAHIGTGTEGLREMLDLLAIPEIRIVAVCDPNQHASGYRDWDKTGLRDSIRRAIGKPDWRPGADGVVPGGREVGKDVVESYYAKNQPGGTYKGCAAYADFREMFDKEKDLNAVKIMTPDHLHALIGIAAMKRGKHVIVHKPLSNRLKEARLMIETARQTGVSTHFMPWDSNGSMDQVMTWINDGSIGTLREIHNCTNRPVWPQWPTLPTDKPPVPEGFDWNLWLGPEAERPYHPDYTHMVFRGWYDFGGGSMADMGHYSLWTVFNALNLEGPTSIEPMLSHNCEIKDSAADTIVNDFSFPTASVVDLFWYEGGMRPPLPDELEEDHGSIPAEAMMFVGDKGKILTGFNIQTPRLIPQRRMQGMAATQPVARRQQGSGPRISEGLQQWVKACKGDKQQSKGSFLNAGPISEAVNLYAIALRTGRRLLYDAQNTRFTNYEAANKYLSREYRKGFDPATV
jgi:hypothetical protein